MEKKLNPLATYLITAFTKPATAAYEQGITVNPIVAELASWYERLRNAMDYRDDEVILRAAIERILRRRLIMGGSGTSVAEPLVRELIWARYFPDGSVPQSIIKDIASIIDSFLKLRAALIQQHILSDNEVHTWIYQLMSAKIERTLNPKIDKDTMANFAFHVIRKNITITDDTLESKDIQVFIAVRRAYAKDDLAFLRYYLFEQYFGSITSDTIPHIASQFIKAHKEIEKQLNHPLTHRIFNYVKKKTPSLFILEDVLRAHKNDITELIKNEDALKKAIFDECNREYKLIGQKVRRAIIRSVIFLLISKALFAFAIEATYENILYGHIQWQAMMINIFAPPSLMVIASLFIRTPGQENSQRIFANIKRLLFDPDPRLDFSITLSVKADTSRPLLNMVFTILWLGTFIISFGLISLLLSRLGFSIVNQGVFLFFLAIVSFLTLRINKTAHSYTLAGKPTVLSTIVDFFYLPIAQVGRHLTEGISQINIFLFILDFFIETPFKGLFAFFEQWLLFMHSKREYLE